MKEYLAKFRQGSGGMAMNAIDFYLENRNIIKHAWAMGGETKKQVYHVSNEINNFLKVEL